MKVNDYVRTKQGIEKIKVVEENFMGDENCIFYATDNKEWRGAYNGKYNGFTNRNRTIIKSSPNIIDLIEVGDYVNGMKITNKYIDEETGNIELGFNNGSSYLYPKSWNYEARSEEYKIKSIVTSEQFSQMEYRIG